MVQAESTGRNYSITYTVGTSAEIQTASLEKIGDMTDLPKGEVFLASLPKDSIIKSFDFSNDGVSPIAGEVGYYRFYNEQLRRTFGTKINNPDEYVKNEQFTSIISMMGTKSFLPAGDYDNNTATFSYIEGKENAIKTNDVAGTVIMFLDSKWDDDEEDYIGDPDADVVFIQIPMETATEVDKSGLKDLLDKIPETGYYTENDYWNGRSESENGFWTDLQAIKEQIQSAYDDDSLSQAQVNAKITQFSDPLDQAIDNLISVNNVNASLLYSTKKTIDMMEWDPNRYSEGSWQLFTTARGVVDDLLANLYNSEDGKPTEGNGTTIQQDDVYNANELLIAAKNNLLGKDAESTLPRWRNVANWVLLQDRNEAGYTESSWSLWITAKETLDELVKQGDEDILKSKASYNGFIKAICDAVSSWYALETKANSITVHVRVIDNYGMRHPEYAIKDERTAAFDGEITLSGRKTIQDLFDDGELDTSPLQTTRYEDELVTDDDKINNTGNKFSIPTQKLHSHTYAYVNGKLVVNRSQNQGGESIENAVLSHFDIYGGVFNTNNLPLEEHFPVLKTKLSDGDDIVLIRTEAPLWHSFTASAGHLCNLADYRYLYHNFTELIVDGDQLIEAKPDDKITLTVKEEEKTVDVSDTNQKSAEGVNLFLSNPQISEEAAKSEPTLNIITEPDGDDVKPVETDDKGKVEFSVDKEGWYKLQPSKGGETLEIYGDLDGITKDGIFPNLAAGKPIIVHISLDDEFDELTEPETAVKDAFEALETAETAYEASKTAAKEASETPGEEAVEAAKKAVTDAEAAIQAAETAKAASEAYLEKVNALAEKKDSMSTAHQTEIAETLAAAEENVQNAESAITSGNEEVAQAKEVLDKAETKAALKLYQEEIEQLKSDIQAKQQEIDDLNGEISDLKEQNTANQTKIDNLETEIAEAEGKIASLEESGDSNQEEIEQLKSDIQAKQQKIDDLNEQITANQGEINQLKDKVEAAQSAIDTMSQADPLAEARTEAINRVNKYLEENTKNMLASDADSAELAALKALLTIKDAKTADEITKAADAAIAKFDEKIAAKKAADEKAAKIKAAKAQKVTGLKVKVKKNKATVSWKKNTEVTGYEVYRSTKKKSGYKKIKTLKKNTKIKFVNKKLKKGKKYFYKVRSFTTIDGKAYYGKYTAVKATKKIK